MTYHPPAWLREMHDAARCPDPCPLCAQIENYEPVEHEGRYLMTVEDYPER